MSATITPEMLRDLATTPIGRNVYYGVCGNLSVIIYDHTVPGEPPNGRRKNYLVASTSGFTGAPGTDTRIGLNVIK